MIIVLKKSLFYVVKNLLLHLVLEIFFKELLNKKETKLFYKNSELPILEELIDIINAIKILSLI